MSLEAIEQISALEERLRAEKSAAESQSRTMKEEAVRAGEALLETIRGEMAEQEKLLLAQAEERAAQRGAGIARDAAAHSAEAREEAEKNLSRAVEFIVERVVNN